MAELSVRRDFKRELRRFLGHGKESWTLQNTDKTEQILITLSVSQDLPARLSDGTIRLGGCFPHNCQERAEVFFTPSGVIQAIALLYHDCSRSVCSGEEDYTLRILLRQNSPRLKGYVGEWAAAELKRETETFPMFGPAKLANTVVQILAD